MSVEMSAVSEAAGTDFADTSAPDKKKDVQGETVPPKGILQGIIFERFKKKGNYLPKSVITKCMNEHAEHHRGACCLVDTPSCHHANAIDDKVYYKKSQK